MFDCYVTLFTSIKYTVSFIEGCFAFTLDTWAPLPSQLTPWKIGWREKVNVMKIPPKKEYMYEGRSICNEKAFITPSINAFRSYTRSKLVLYFIFLTY